MRPLIYEANSTSGSEIFVLKKNIGKENDHEVGRQAVEKDQSKKKSLPAPNQGIRVAPSAESASQKIRSKFLNRLGISKLNTPPASAAAAAAAAVSHGQQAPPVTRHERQQSYVEVLKADYGRRDEMLDETAWSSLSSSPEHDSKPPMFYVKSNEDRHVSFGSTVRVRPIPSRRDYSNRIRGVLWTPVQEIQENAARNTIEFAAENWDWKQVTEEKDMFVLVESGELVHPVHFGVYPNQ